MNDIRTPILAVGYLAALTVAVFGLGAFDFTSGGRSLVMVVPVAMLAAVTWSATQWRGSIAIIVSGIVWLSFAGVAASMLVDWTAWEHLGLAALVAPVIGSRVLMSRGIDDVISGEREMLRQAA